MPAGVPLLAFGADAGAEPRLLVLNKDTGEVRFDLMVFGPQFKGGVRVAVGDVTGDGQDDVIAAGGFGSTRVKVFDGATGELVSKFTAAAPAASPITGLLASQLATRAPGSYVGGVTVAAGDLNGDGRAEVITGSEAGGPTVIAVYDGRTGRQLRSFTVASLGSLGARVAAGDVNGDGRAEIFAGPATGRGCLVRVFDGRTFLPKPGFRALADAPHKNGVFVAAADVDGDGFTEVVVGAGTGATVEVRDPRTGGLRRTFQANVPADTGVRVGSTLFGDDGQADILCGSADAASWAAFDGAGAGLAGGAPDGFNTGLWVAGSPEHAAINRHASQVILDWNAAALDVIRTEKTPPPWASRALAILQTAVFDAVNGIGRAYRVYQVAAKAWVGASVPAAAAQAAHTALVALFPNQKAQFDALLATSLANIPDGTAKSDGTAWGDQVARSILAVRAFDGSGAAAIYTPGSAPGDWQPTPPAYANPLLPGWGNVVPFGIRNPARYVPQAPPALTSEQYATELDEVRRLGRKDSTDRTADQTEIARFWADGAGTYTPPGHWNAIAAQLAAADGLPVVTTARLFAQLDVAGADAAVVCWKTKYGYNLWRPVTAIHNADADGNSQTVADPTWEPLLTTPPFPSYTSGHSTFSGAASTVLAGYFGAGRAFATTSDDGTVTRSFTSFAQAADEAGRSRIYGGIHYQSDNQSGLACGREVGAFVLRRLLQSR